MGETLLRIVQTYPLLTSPATVAVLIVAATLSLWVAVRPRRRQSREDERLDNYVLRREALEESELSGSFWSRVIAPGIRKLLRKLGSLLPNRAAERTRRMLIHAGEPGHLSVLDYQGLRLLLAVTFAALAYLNFAGRETAGRVVQFTALAAVMGFLLPWYYMRARIRKRRNTIARALPNAIDMMTIGVEAGLAFESSMLRVAQKWRNALTAELLRAIAEMNVGVSREEALRRMAERTDVPELQTFVAVLVQSSELGMSIADVLHTQAAQMRLKRRQRVEEISRQASIKLVVVLVFLVFPALFIIILGPAVPQIFSLMGSLG